MNQGLWRRTRTVLQKWKCYYCHRLMIERSADPRDHGKVALLDYMIPVSRGGAREYGNTSAICAKCYHAKGKMTDNEYLTFLDD